MKPYSSKISLVRNGRGVYCIDTTMGCSSGMQNSIGGCYNDCYAAKTAKRYGHDFSQTVLRNFENLKHKREILAQINEVKMPFIRIGCSGDPSENWEHSLNIIKVLAKCNIEIVIITRHWTLLTDKQLEYFSKINICINTSISALDSEILRECCLTQFKRMQKYCRSILRIVSCDFNLENEIGYKLFQIQEQLFKNVSTLDTVFRPSKKNQLILSGIINAKDEVFNGRKSFASKYNRKTYMGKCSSCQEMCGVNIKSENSYPDKRPLTKQLLIFTK
jgi:transcription termination factor NusB